MERPNIVMLVTDHQVYSHHSPIMPHSDRFREDGFSFSRAACVSPLCGPARRSLLTGLYPHNHHNLFNFAPAPFVEETYLDVLHAAGYRNYEYGKWHAGPGTAHDHHTEGFSIPEYGNPYITEEYGEYLRRHDLPPAEHEIFRVFPNDNTAETFPRLKEGERHYRCGSYWCGEQCVGRTVTPKETHEAFFKRIRKAHPDLPIIILGKITGATDERDAIVRATYENAVKTGDKKVWFVDGKKLFEGADVSYLTVDKCHPNDLGFYLMFRNSLPTLKKALGAE